ncbi:MAG: pyridoxine 5'-phosphate synthase [Candidatus Gastranaerophilales bacterium]|nr:pyridoxine 5'-phosphate synthase [Candidatus Gastranaerophilales bacterium]
MLLGVNIDHIATLRNARGGIEPNLLECAKMCINNGADSITTHLREDRRHIKDNDVKIIRAELKTKLNLEMAMTDEMQEIALKLVPDAICLVPEKRAELTTEGGLDIAGQLEHGKKFIKPLADKGIEVSLFIDPDINQISAAYKSGAQFIELHTGAYSNTFGSDKEKKSFEDLKTASAFARTMGLKVNAGHGLNYQNVVRMHEIPDLYELNIGHSIISRAISVGLPQAVKEMKELVTNEEIQRRSS